MELLMLWFLFGVAAAFIGEKQGGSGCLWFLMGVMLGPFGLIMSIFAGPRKSNAGRG